MTEDLSEIYTSANKKWRLFDINTLYTNSNELVGYKQ